VLLRKMGGLSVPFTVHFMNTSMEVVATLELAGQAERWAAHPSEQKLAEGVAQNQQLTDADFSCP
jgi:hypothetical protein